MTGSKRVLEKFRGYTFGFQVSPANPCMLFKENELGVCIIIMYVDDMLIIGKKEQIQEFATKIQKEYEEDGKIIMKFVKSEDNEADIFTKTTTNTIFEITRRS